MKLGGIIGALLFVGGVAAGIKYYEKYKQDHAELEEDFDEFEESDEQAFDNTNEESDFVEDDDPNRKYTSLNSNKEEFVEAAKNTLEAAKGMVEPAKGIVKNLGEIITEKVDDSSIVAGDYVSTVREKVDNIVEETKSRLNVIEEDVLNKPAEEEDTTDDIIIDIDISGDVKEGDFKEKE